MTDPLDLWHIIYFAFGAFAAMLVLTGRGA